MPSMMYVSGQCVVGIWLVAALAALFGAATPERNSILQGTEQEAKRTPDTGLPRGAITRLGSPTIHQNNLGANLVMFLSDGRTVVSAGPQAKLCFWEALTGKLIRSYPGHIYVALSPDGKRVASRTDAVRPSVARLKDLQSDKDIGQVDCGVGSRGALCVSADGRYLATGGGTNYHRPDDPILRIWDLGTAKEVQRIPQRDILNAMSFSPDGKYLLTATIFNNPAKVHVWACASGKLIHSFVEEKPFEVRALRMSPDGTFLAAAASQPRLWELPSRREIWRVFFKGEESGLDLAFSPNGQTLAIGTTQGNVYLYEPATGRERAVIKTGVPYVNSVAFSPCGLMLASAGRDCAPLIWDATGRIRGSTAKAQPLTAKELDELLADLHRQDAGKAWQAICTLAARPDQAAALLKGRLAPSRMGYPKLLARLRASLDSDEFETRDNASRELRILGPAAISSLKQLLDTDTASAEAKSRARGVLADIAKSGLVAEELYYGRMLEVLEYAGGAAANGLLTEEANAEPVSRQSAAAKDAVERIAKRPPSR